MLVFRTRTLSAIVAAVAVSLSCLPAAAQDAKLIEAAKKEGSLTWYTTQIINQFARPAAEAFQKKYGIKVDYIRADSNEVALRISNEGKAGKVMADVFDGTAAVATLKREDLVMQWVPEGAKHLPANAVDKNGYWVATNLYVLTPGFNTDLIAPGTEPKSFQDLLDPKWKGKIAWNSSPTPSGAGGFTGLVLTSMGEEKGKAYLHQLAKQNISGLQVAARQVLDQVIAGEYAIALNIFNNHAVISAAKGAPSAWIKWDPAMAVFSVASITKGAQHPNAAKLFLEFLVSKEGQQIYRAADYMPIDPEVPAKDPSLRPDDKTFKALYFTPEDIFEKMPKWAAVYKDIFR
jgi:ABC-type Fe3+ transport system substrate-binding protein